MDLSYGHSPFPFTERPGLPDINKHLGPETLKSRQFIKLEKETEVNAPETPREDEQQSSYGYFTVKEIRNVYKFIKSNGVLDERRFGISLDELEHAFRRVRRARQSQESENKARRLMNTMEFLLKLKRITPKQWFRSVDTSQANKGDGKLTQIEFETGMNRTCEELGAAMFLKHELVAMIKYMDPNGDGDLSFEEVQNGFEKIHRTAISTETILKSGPIMLYLLDYLHEQQIRVRDLFNFMDLKNRKVVEIGDLCSGLERISSILQPSQELIKEYGLLKENPGPMKPVKTLKEADSVHKLLARKKKLLVTQQDRTLQESSSGSLPSIKTRGAGDTMSGGFIPLSPIKRTNKEYNKQIHKSFSVYYDWMHQFDRKLQNGLITMSKM